MHLFCWLIDFSSMKLIILRWQLLAWVGWDCWYIGSWSHYESFHWYNRDISQKFMMVITLKFFIVINGENDDGECWLLYFIGEILTVIDNSSGDEDDHDADDDDDDDGCGCGCGCECGCCWCCCCCFEISRKTLTIIVLNNGWKVEIPRNFLDLSKPLNSRNFRGKKLFFV